MSLTLQARHIRFPLKAPFRIARGVKTAADTISVSIANGSGTGRGESIPYARYGESIESVLAQIEAARGAIEGGADRAVLQTLLPPGAARNALDCALWDLEAKSSGEPVAEMIGKPAPGPIATALTISIDTPEAMAAAAAQVRGAPLLKIKVDARDPKALIAAVREAAPEPDLIVDPNESWDRALMTAMQDALVEARVSLLEQPVPAGEDDWLEGFDPAVPVCADEAFHVAADLPAVARRYQAVNVKLDKTGGLTAALEAAHAARDMGLKLMTGCMVSSSLSIAPAMHVAALSDFADLDGPWWLLEDRTGGVRVDDGMIHPPTAGFWGTR